MVTAKKAFGMLVALGSVIFGISLGALLAGAEEEKALMDFFKRRRPAGIKLRPKFPYPYDYLYAALLESLPKVEAEQKPGDSKNFSPLEAQPGSPEEALRDMVIAWRDGKPELIKRHLDPRTPIACYVKGVYSHLLSPEEFLSFTQVAMSRLRTLALRFGRPVRVSEGKFSATGVHVFADPKGRRRSVAVEVTFVRIGEVWVVKSINYGPKGERRRKGKCVISSAIFGSESREVAILVAFRDRCLSQSLIGRWMIKAYYRLAGPAADFIERGGPITRGLMRWILEPSVCLARWAFEASHTPSPPGPELSGI